MNTEAGSTVEEYPKELQECSSAYQECQVQRYLFVVGAPILVVVSLIGNTLTLAAMMRQKQRKTATGVLILFLAVADTFANVIGLTRHFILKKFQVDVRKLSPEACKIHRFSLYLAMDVSSWILVAVTIERFLAVCHPLAHRKFKSAKTGLLSVAVIFICQIAFNIQVFWTRGIQYVTGRNGSLDTLNCGYTSREANDFWTYYNSWISMLIYCLIPFVIMLVLNFLIIKKLKRINDNLLSRNGHLGSQVGIATKATSMTRMLLSVNIYFLVVTTPVFIFTMVQGIAVDKEDMSDEYYSRLELVDAICTLTLYVNHSINFLLYCMTGRRFRYELKSMFNQVKVSIISRRKSLMMSHCDNDLTRMPIETKA